MSLVKSHKYMDIFVTFLMISMLNASSAARLLNEYIPGKFPAKDEPTSLNILTSDNVKDSIPVTTPEKKAISCHMEFNKNSGAKAPAQKLAGKYGPLLLNVLPKGTVTPSGPSKGTNDDQN